MDVKISGSDLFVGQEGKELLIELTKKTFLQIGMRTDNLPEIQIESVDEKGLTSYSLSVKIPNINSHAEVVEALSNALYSDKEYFADKIRDDVEPLDYLPIKISSDMTYGVLEITCEDHSRKFDQQNDCPIGPDLS